MPQVKIHISSSISDENKNIMVNSIRKAIPSVLNIDQKIGQVMLYESSYRANHQSRDKNFVFVEITMYVGRDYELKKKLAEMITAEITRLADVDRADINIAYYELKPENYFGGTSHSYIENLKQD